MRARSRQGFTLVELIVMMVVIGILVGVAVPNFSGAQDKARNSGIQHNVHLRIAQTQHRLISLEHVFVFK
jgi:prepilin-type N-terminal cleavage/methylation domain-containing protein